MKKTFVSFMFAINVMALIALLISTYINLSTSKSSDTRVGELQAAINQNKNVMTAGQPLPNYLKELIQCSDIIIRGKITGKLGMYHYKSDKGSSMVRTQYEVDIKSALKGNPQNKVVLSLYYKLALPVDLNKEYIIFLYHKKDDNKNTYSFVSTDYGIFTIGKRSVYNNYTSTTIAKLKMVILLQMLKQNMIIILSLSIVIINSSLMVLLYPKRRKNIFKKFRHSRIN